MPLPSGPSLSALQPAPDLPFPVDLADLLELSPLSIWEEADFREASLPGEIWDYDWLLHAREGDSSIDKTGRSGSGKTQLSTPYAAPCGTPPAANAPTPSSIDEASEDGGGGLCLLLPSGLECAVQPVWQAPWDEEEGGLAGLLEREVSTSSRRSGRAHTHTHI